jgi:hypothetical protein
MEIANVETAVAAVVTPVAVAVAVRCVPSTVLVRVTTGVPKKPEPVIVVGIAVAAAVSAPVVTLKDEDVGGALTVTPDASVAVPALSVTVMPYVPATVADVDAKLPVTVAAPELSITLENVSPGAVDVTVTFPRSPAKAPLIVKVPEAPLPKKGWLTVVPGEAAENVTELIESAAPAAVAIAIGSAAAASKAPAAKAFTKWRCIRLGLFINSLHS